MLNVDVHRIIVITCPIHKYNLRIFIMLNVNVYRVIVITCAIHHAKCQCL